MNPRTDVRLQNLYWNSEELNFKPDVSTNYFQNGPECSNLKMHI